MCDVYNEVNDAEVSLEVDGNELVIRIQYLAGDAEEIKNLLENKSGD